MLRADLSLESIGLLNFLIPVYVALTKIRSYSDQQSHRRFAIPAAAAHMSTCNPRAQVRENAENKVWERLRALNASVRRRGRGGGATVGLLGCMAERLKVAASGDVCMYAHSGPPLDGGLDGDLPTCPPTTLASYLI